MNGAPGTFSIKEANTRITEQILGTIGPISTSLGGLKLLMKTVLDAEPWLMEPGLTDHPWRDVRESCQYTSTKKLKIAVMWDDGVVRPHPPVTRALNEVVSKLKDLNWVEIVPWKPKDHDYACKSPCPSQRLCRTRLTYIFYRDSDLSTLLPRCRYCRKGGNQGLWRAMASIVRLDLA